MEAPIVQTNQLPPLVPATGSQADSDEDLIDLWLLARSENTRQAYGADIRRFQAFAAKPLSSVTLRDLQSFINQLEGLAESSRARVTSSIKSLFSFAHNVGYVRFNVGRVTLQWSFVGSVPLSNLLARASRQRYISRVAVSIGLSWLTAEVPRSGRGSNSRPSPAGVRSRIVRRFSDRSS